MMDFTNTGDLINAATLSAVGLYNPRSRQYIRVNPACTVLLWTGIGLMDARYFEQNRQSRSMCYWSIGNINERTGLMPKVESCERFKMREFLISDPAVMLSGWIRPDEVFTYIL